jgi:hypothetical protein
MNIVRLQACPSTRPSVRMGQLGSHWTYFHKIGYLSIFRISVEKILSLLKPKYIYDNILLTFPYNEKCFRLTL